MFIISDRVKETSTTSGSGSISLNGAYGAFQTFLDGIGDGSTTYYTIENNARWEVGQGSYDAATNSLSRDVIFSPISISKSEMAPWYCCWMFNGLGFESLHSLRDPSSIIPISCSLSIELHFIIMNS